MPQTWQGYLAEGMFILDNATFSTAQMGQMESYLAMKYGITLGGNASTTSAYTNSAGTTTWAANSAYHNNVAGVAADVFHKLDQRISRSSNPGAQLVATTNASMPTPGASAISAQTGVALADKSSILWGDNAGSTLNSTTTTAPVLSGKQLSTRIWRLQLVGTAPTQLTVCIPTSMFPASFTGTGASGLNVVVAKDSAFTTFSSTYAVAPTATTCPATGVGNSSTAGYVATLPNAALTGWTGGVAYLGVVAAVPMVDHVEVTTPLATGLTCQSQVYTIKACANAACTSVYTGGLTGNLSLTGPGATVTPASSQAFTTNAVTGLATVTAQVTTPSTVTVDVTGLSLAPSNVKKLFCGLGSAASSTGACTQLMTDTGFQFNIPDHVSGATPTVTLSAIRTDSKTQACVAAVQNKTLALNFSCGYNNPTSGTLAPLINGVACNSSASSRNLSFDATGQASFTARYLDVGKIDVQATYNGAVGTGDNGLVMTGLDSFIAAPAGFRFSAVTTGTLKAGVPFSATVEAINSASPVTVTPNFGREVSPESVTLSFTKAQPTGAGSVSGSFTGSVGAFSSGAATSSNAVWSEVGKIDLTATLSSGSYQGTGLSGSGTTGTAGAIGPFTPDHFDLTLVSGCAAAGFTYAGQPFSATLTARAAVAAGGNVTQNYDGRTGASGTTPNFAKAVTLSSSSAQAGALTGTSMAASAFNAGVATVSVGYTPTVRLTKPFSVALHVADVDGVVSATDPSTDLRVGQIAMFNAFGNGKSVLQVPLQVQYWSGKSWTISSQDSCTRTQLTAASVVRAATFNSDNSPASWSSAVSVITWDSNAQGYITMAPPSPSGGTGSVDLVLNLGASSTDASCMSTHPPSTGAQLSGLRTWGKCQTGSADAFFDPRARATFGVYAPEVKKVIITYELY